MRRVCPVRFDCIGRIGFPLRQFSDPLTMNKPVTLYAELAVLAIVCFVAMNWGYDYDLARGLMDRIGVGIDKNHVLEFPSGSMFWGRSAAIRGTISTAG